MKRLGFTAQFKKDFRNAIKRGADKAKIDEVVLRLRQDVPLENKHKDHSLNGNWKNHRECHVAPDWLLIYQSFPDEIVLVRSGTHSEIFRK